MLLEAVPAGTGLADTVELGGRHRSQDFDHRTLVRRTVVAVDSLLELDTLVVVVADVAVVDDNLLVDILQML